MGNFSDCHDLYWIDLQGVVEVKYIRERAEQERILRAQLVCHPPPPRQSWSQLVRHPPLPPHRRSQLTVSAMVDVLQRSAPARKVTFLVGLTVILEGTVSIFS